MTQKSFVLLAIIFIVISANIELSESTYNCNDPPLDKVVSYHINRASPLLGTYLNLTGEGTCSFPITTTNKRNTTHTINNNEIVYEEDKILQALFDRGICFLYAFEPFEAMDCFALTIERNPNCPMCYWAFARALSWNFGFRDTLIEARNRSIALSNTYNVTEREKLFINENYKDLTRLNDTNGIGFYSLSIIDDTIHVYNSPYVERCISERLTKDQLAENSENFVAQHLLMHSVEDVNNQTDLIYIRDVMSFDKFEKKSPHLEHMLGHIHFLLGDFPMANKTFFKGYKNDLKRFYNLSMPYENNWELFHNIAYLIGNLAMMGLDQEAMTRYNESLTYFVKEGKYVIPYDPVCNRVAARQYYQTGISAALAYWYFDDFSAANRTINNVAALYPSSNYTMYYYSTLGKYFTIRYMLEGDFSFNVVNATLTQFEKGVLELEKGAINNEETYQVLARNIQALQAMLYEAHALIRYKFFSDAIGAYQLLDRAIAFEQQIVYNEPPIIPLSMNYTKAILTSNYDLVTLHRLLDYPLTKNSHKVLFSLVKYYAEIVKEYDTAKSYLAKIPRESLFYDRAARLIPSPTNWELILLVIVFIVLLGGGYYYYTKHVAISPTAGGPPRKLH